MNVGVGFFVVFFKYFFNLLQAFKVHIAKEMSMKVAFLSL